MHLPLSKATRIPKFIPLSNKGLGKHQQHQRHVSKKNDRGKLCCPTFSTRFMVRLIFVNESFNRKHTHHVASENTNIHNFQCFFSYFVSIVTNASKKNMLVEISCPIRMKALCSPYLHLDPYNTRNTELGTCRVEEVSCKFGQMMQHAVRNNFSMLQSFYPSTSIQFNLVPGP